MNIFIIKKILTVSTSNIYRQFHEQTENIIKERCKLVTESPSKKFLWKTL